MSDLTIAILMALGALLAALFLHWLIGRMIGPHKRVVYDGRWRSTLLPFRLVSWDDPEFRRVPQPGRPGKLGIAVAAIQAVVIVAAVGIFAAYRSPETETQTADMLFLLETVGVAVVGMLVVQIMILAFYGRR